MCSLVTSFCSGELNHLVVYLVPSDTTKCGLSQENLEGSLLGKSTLRKAFEGIAMWFLVHVV